MNAEHQKNIQNLTEQASLNTEGVTSTKKQLARLDAQLYAIKQYQTLSDEDKRAEWQRLLDTHSDAKVEHMVADYSDLHMQTEKKVRNSLRLYGVGVEACAPHFSVCRMHLIIPPGIFHGIASLHR